MKSFFKKTWYLAKPYWISEDKWRALALLIALLICGPLLVRIQVLTNSVNKGFYDALQAYDKTAILKLAANYVVLIVIFGGIAALQGYFGSILINRWRRWLTQHYVTNWLHNNNYYQMMINKQTVDNPDQRIGDDLNDFTALTLSLFGGIYNSIIQLVTFTTLLWQLSGTYILAVKNYTFHIHGYMLWCAIAYSLINTWVTATIGRKLSRLDYDQQHFNADFRFGLMRIREYSEQIAFYNGALAERKLLNKTYEPIFNNFKKIINVNRNLTFFTRSVSYISLMVGTFFALPKFLKERLPLGSVTQLANAFGYVVDALSFIVDINTYQAIASWCAVVNRLTEFTDKITITGNISAKSSLVKLNSNDHIILKNLKLFKPDGEMLAKTINETFLPKEKVLIMAPYGSGKSTLFRAMAGLWPYAEGSITMPTEDVMFLPQKPYLPLGTLKEVICFPKQAEGFSDSEVIKAMQISNLNAFTDKLHINSMWSNEMSLGEQQMLAFARVILKQPKWLFLDEATSAIDEKNQENIYKTLFSVLPDTAFISIGHRQSLTYFHDRIMYLQ